MGQIVEGKEAKVNLTSFQVKKSAVVRRSITPPAATKLSQSQELTSDEVVDSTPERSKTE